MGGMEGLREEGQGKRMKMPRREQRVGRVCGMGERHSCRSISQADVCVVCAHLTQMERQECRSPMLSSVTCTRTMQMERQECRSPMLSTATCTLTMQMERQECRAPMFSTATCIGAQGVEIAEKPTLHIVATRCSRRGIFLRLPWGAGRKGLPRVLGLLYNISELVGRRNVFGETI